MANFRMVINLVAAAAVMGSSAMAADGSLAPGKPAGIHQAARHRTNLLLIGGAAAVAVAAVVIATQSSSNPPAAPITTTTTTTS